ncbi:glycosyl transferase group 1, partial [filamentous cyanobacterium CCP5]
WTLFKQIAGDIVIAYKLKPSSFGLALIYRTFWHRPIILDIDDWELSWHGGDSYQYRPSLKQLTRDLIKPSGALRQLDHPLYLKWIEALTPLADQITTHSGFLQRRFGGINLPNGKNTTQFDPDRYDPETSRCKYGLQDYRVLMFPGAPRPYKGVEDMLMALDQLQQADLKLVIVGGSPYDNYDRQLHQRWGQHIIQLPKTAYMEMPELIAAAHVLVVPQRNTPAAQAQFPLKLTDGMAMAKPVLATRVGDIPEILGETGYLAEPESPGDLAAQINHIFQDYDQALGRGRRARERCIERYSLGTMGQTLTRLVENLVA